MSKRAKTIWVYILYFGTVALAMGVGILMNIEIDTGIDNYNNHQYLYDTEVEIVETEVIVIETIIKYIELQPIEVIEIQYVEIEVEVIIDLSAARLKYFRDMLDLYEDALEDAWEVIEDFHYDYESRVANGESLTAEEIVEYLMLIELIDKLEGEYSDRYDEIKQTYRDKEAEGTE